MTDHSFAIFDTAIGRCGIAWGEHGINAVQLPMSSEEKTRARIRQRYGDLAEAPPTAEVQRASDSAVRFRTRCRMERGRVSGRRGHAAHSPRWATAFCSGSVETLIHPLSG